MRSRALGFGKKMYRQAQDDDLMTEAAAAAYHILFAVVPLLIFLTALSGFVSRAIGQGDAVTEVQDWIFEQFPQSTAQAVQEPVEQVLTQQSGGLLSFGAVLALWGAKNAVAAMMKGLNVAFDVEDTRSWPRRNLVAIGLTVALGLALIICSVTLVMALTVWEEIVDALGLSESLASLSSWLRWPLIVVILLLALAAFYWAGPNVAVPFRGVLPGAVLTLVLWGIATLGLSIYFGYGGSYASTYGVLGGVLAFVFWLYVTSLILLIGGELNAVLLQRGADAAAPEQREPRDRPAARRQETAEA